MNYYYGIQRSDEWLAHYGIKGMKWGVRKAIERGDSAALMKHYKKASKKLDKLKKKTNLSDAARSQYLGRSLGRAFGSVTGAHAGLLGAAAANEVARKGTAALSEVAPLSGLLLAPTALAAAGGGVAYLKGKNRMSSKGHAKNVRKAQEFADAAKAAFKGTAHEQDINKQTKFNDEYRLVDVGRNPRTGEMEARPIAKIQGSHLTSDYHGKDKQKFMKLAGEKVKPFDNNGVHLRSLETGVDRFTKSHDPMEFAYNTNAVLPRSQRKKMSPHESSRGAYYQSLGKSDPSDNYTPKPQNKKLNGPSRKRKR